LRKSKKGKPDGLILDGMDGSGTISYGRPRLERDCFANDDDDDDDDDGDDDDDYDDDDDDSDNYLTVTKTSLAVKRERPGLYENSFQFTD
jgi:hypothetical protein